jgi:two-component system, OmpR family, response regulator ChvI
LFNSAASSKYGNRVLLVDDEPDITFSFNMILEDNGFAVDTFNDPLDALSSFRSGLYAIAVLDIRMPNMNGFELCSELRKADDNIKFVFMTAYDIHSEDNNNDIKFILMNEKPIILKKPISLNEFVNKIKKELDSNSNN